MTVAALYVDPAGAYCGLADVELWNLPDRDAREYAGPHPVVAHPPCSRWCRLAGLVEARWGHKRGEDGGCFESALAAVRKWGGVLEHPAYSGAWAAFDLLSPPTGGGWVNADMIGGWTCYVEQGHYGHRARKPTWLYAHGIDPPSLRWGHVPDRDVKAMVSWCGNHTRPRAIVGRMWKTGCGDKGPDTRRRIGKKTASATPRAFRDTLLVMVAGESLRPPPGPANPGDSPAATQLEFGE